ncbi:pilus assembly protein TadG-related protein [Microbacterium sp. X-17]|uniref:pilus assembly protein TadG-related protein n=1 Tax=Microbacterium sp. X-17 TaxID=3144404 RepID=UPI0031F5A571
MRRLAADEDGSILPLAVGYALLALVLVFVCTCATSLHLAQQRLDQLADAAALAGADGFTIALEQGAPVATLTDAAVRAQAEAILAGEEDVVLASATAPDGRSARVEVRAQWRTPILSAFVPATVTLASIATSRTALR